MSVNLSIIGLWNYDDTLFDDMALPESVDRDILVKNILLECAELEVLYPDPDFMKLAIEAWSQKMLPTWSSLATTFDLEYNPIWNVDGTETEKETRNLASSNKETRNLASSNLETRDLESSGSSTAINQDNGTSTHKVNGFNEIELKDAESDTSVTSSNSSITNSGTDEGTISHAGTDTGTIEHGGTDTGTITRTKTRGGNIGVTMTQQMLEAEIAVRPKLNIYSFIIESFKDRFCLLIY